MSITFVKRRGKEAGRTRRRSGDDRTGLCQRDKKQWSRGIRIIQDEASQYRVVGGVRDTRRPMFGQLHGTVTSGTTLLPTVRGIRLATVCRSIALATNYGIFYEVALVAVCPGNIEGVELLQDCHPPPQLPPNYGVD